MLWVSVGIGLALSLLFAEWLGIAAGGLVVPGYIALFWDKPLQIVGTLVGAFVCLGLLRIISLKAFVYGRRRLVLTILLGFIVGLCMRFALNRFPLGVEWNFDPIGFVIPGLLAYWMEKQGVIETISGMVIASVIVRMCLILINGGAPIDVTWF